MSRRPTDTEVPARRGYDLIAGELLRRGWTLRQLRDGGVTFLEGTSARGRVVRVRVKTRTSGTWQATTTSGEEAPAPAPVPTFWTFVDLATDPAEVFVAPDDWVRRDIFHVHREYLKGHDDRRPMNAESTHHAIATKRVERWRDRWELLDGDAAGVG